SQTPWSPLYHDTHTQVSSTADTTVTAASPRRQPLTDPDIRLPTKYLPSRMWTTSVGSDASSAPDIAAPEFCSWTACARLLSASVTGPVFAVEKKTANRKSFHADVNCQISTTTKLGSEIGSTTHA